MEAIRAMEDSWTKVNGSNFRLVDYRDAKGEMRPEYKLSKTECLYVATKFNRGLAEANLTSEIISSG